ncbi:MAG: phosphopyruvate hydratase [Candidatus Paceibacterota bacterium]
MKKLNIKSLKVGEILDSNGRPTIEVRLSTNFGVFSASVPSGESTGKYEAVELRDKDGKGVLRAIENIEKIIFPVVKEADVLNQKKIDEILIELDGTKNKSSLGANAILAVSMVFCRVGAAVKGIPLYLYISEMAAGKYGLPKPSFNMIEGGKHSDSGLVFQEFMVVPQKNLFKENLETGIKIYKKLKTILKKKYGRSISLSREGAFSGPSDIYEALDSILEAGKGEDFKIAIDVAASSFYQDGFYKIGGKNVSREDLKRIYQDIVSRYPVVSIEDPFFEEDFEGMVGLDNITVFGDDITVSNVERMKLSKEKSACNGLILKPNQIGTISETLEAAKLARSFDWKIMVANRAGETKDDFIADLAVGISADFIKSGAPYPKERMVKYNRLKMIESELAH